MILHLDETSKIVKKDKGLFVSQEQAKKRYLTHHNQLTDERYLKYQTSIYETFVSLYLKTPDILDYGCGEAAPLKYVSGLEMALYDLYFFNDESVFNKRYDTIILIEIVEHFEDPFDTFDKLCSLLKPGGRLIVQTEFKPAFADILDWWYIRDETHVSFYDLEVFQYIAKRFDLSVIYTNDKNRIVLQKEVK